MPSGIGIIDTMIGFPHQDMAATYAFITRQTKDRESQEQFEFPVEYMFKNVPERGLAEEGDPISVTLREMDRWGVERGMIHVGDVGALALKQHPDRFIASTTFDPNLGMDAIRQLGREYETFGVRRRLLPRARCRRWPSTTRRCTRSTPSAWSLASPCSAAPACRGRACGWTRSASS
jgi:predicted TIM-barrel fold metal-dependent hydrolase